MDKYDPNQKHPKIDFKGEYPNIYVTQGADGYQIIRSLQPGKESFFEIFPSGSYRGQGPDGQQVEVSMGKQHSYGADGKSITQDGHVDEKTGGTHRHNVDGSQHQEVAGNKTAAGGGISIEGSKDSKIESQSQGDKFHTTSGSVTSEHTGNVHHSVIGDEVFMVKGNRHDSVSKGEYGINIQNGNYDTKVNEGKMRFEVEKNISVISHDQINMLVDRGVGTIKTRATKQTTLMVGIDPNSNVDITPSTITTSTTQNITNKVGNSSNTIITPSEITIQTTSKITIKCGASTIELSPAGIKITGARIDLN